MDTSFATVDVTSFVITDQVATRIERRGDVGRGGVVVASKGFEAVGSTIFREKPLLVWKSGSWKDYLEVYLDASPKVKALINDMFTPEEESDLMKSALKAARVLVDNSPGARQLDLDLVQKHIGVAMINAREYYGHTDHAFVEIPSPNPLRSEKSALFAYGSKVAHSCSPNAFYSTKTADGCLEYKTIRPIARDETITFSYLEKPTSTSTHLRREHLFKSQSFICMCERCKGPDFARFHQCPTNGCDEYIACVCHVFNGPTEWSCPKCGKLQGVKEKLEAKEDKVSNALKHIKSKVSLVGGVCNVHPGEIKQIVRFARKTLTPLHFLTLQALQELSKVCASHACGIQQATLGGLLPQDAPTPYGTLVQLRLTAAQAGLEYVSACECTAVGCNGCKVGKGNHPPTYECAADVFYAYQDLKAIPKPQWPAFAAVMMKRYLDFLYTGFGKGDVDVKEMEATIKPKQESKLPLQDAVGGNNNDKPTRPANKNKKKTRKLLGFLSR